MICSPKVAIAEMYRADGLVVGVRAVHVLPSKLHVSFKYAKLASTPPKRTKWPSSVAPMHPLRALGPTTDGDDQPLPFQSHVSARATVGEGSPPKTMTPSPSEADAAP